MNDTEHDNIHDKSIKRNLENSKFKFIFIIFYSNFKIPQIYSDNIDDSSTNENSQPKTQIMRPRTSFLIYSIDRRPII